MISKILIPTDGSEVAQMAARYGVDLAKQLKASVKDTKILVLVVKR